MLSRCNVALAVCVVLACTAAYADVIEVEGTVKEINAEERTLTLSRKRGKAEKVIELEVSEKADIKAGESDADLADIKEGDEVAIKYDSKLEIVTELVKGGADEKNYAKLLRKKFAASKATLDPKTGVLTLTYDFAKPTQLKDFDTENVTPELLGGGVIKVPAAESLGHIVRFREVTASGTFKIQNTGDYTDVIGFTNGAVLKKWEWEHRFMLQIGQEETVTPTAASPLRAIQMLYDGKKVRARINNKAELGLPCKSAESVGVVLHGGRGGIAVGGLVISGTPDPIWFKEFMDK